MEKEVKQDNSRKVLAFVLIGIGVLWILRKIGFYFDFPAWHWNNLFFPFQPVFHGLENFLFSWQVIFIIIGLILMAGRRRSGVVFIAIGGIFLIPKILFFPHITFSIIFPVILIGLGVALVARHV